jgi:gp16 family phage-associated protein
LRIDYLSLKTDTNHNNTHSNRRIDVTLSPHPNTLRTPDEVLAWFRTNGISIAGWCRENGFSRNVVNSLLHAGLPGLRGQAHKAAIALRLKAAPEQAQVGENHE